MISPPAGVIGRGDAFLLQIADRADAVVLSNDSFQEFHGQYTWLFEPGRLVGGKPVPHVGWVFMNRSPVRGPLSRRSVSDAKRAAKDAAAPVVAEVVSAVPTSAASGGAPAKRRRGAASAPSAPAGRTSKQSGRSPRSSGRRPGPRRRPRHQHRRRWGR